MHARRSNRCTRVCTRHCIDRHIDTPLRNKAAIVWEGEPGDRRTLTYWDLYVEVRKFANVLKKLGVTRGDRVAIYLPMIPEAAIAMLALPTDVNFLEAIVLPKDQLYLGRG